MAKSIKPPEAENTRSIRTGLIVTGPSTEQSWVFAVLLAHLLSPKGKENLITHAGMGEILLEWGVCQSSPLGVELRKAVDQEESAGTPIPTELMVRTLQAWCAHTGKITREVLLLISPPTFVNSVISEFCDNAKTLHVDFDRDPLSSALRKTLMEMEEHGGPVNPVLVKTALNRIGEVNHPIHEVIDSIEKSMSPATPAQPQLAVAPI